MNLKNEIEALKKKRKTAESEAKSLNDGNEILQKELNVSKFEFSEIEKRYNGAKQDRLAAKNHLYDCIIEAENAYFRIKSIPEELEMLEFNTKEKIELMKRQIKLSKEAIVPLEPAVEEINVTVDHLNEVCLRRKLARIVCMKPLLPSNV